jgi:predicted metalloprotease with PDZ domain
MRWWLICILMIPVAQAEVETWVQQLGADELEVRNAAQVRLAEQGVQTPRRMMMKLAQAYQEAEDLEIQTRLEVLLTDLAREWMFYVPLGFLGINFEMVDLEEGEKGILILQVLSGGAAEDAGLINGDIILKIENMDIGDFEDQQGFVEFVSELRPGFEAELHLRREGADRILLMRIGHRSGMQMDSRMYAREEKKLSDWLSVLRGTPGKDPARPVGHFQIPEE